MTDSDFKEMLLRAFDEFRKEIRDDIGEIKDIIRPQGELLNHHQRRLDNADVARKALASDTERRTTRFRLWAMITGGCVAAVLGSVVLILLDHLFR